MTQRRNRRIPNSQPIWARWQFKAGCSLIPNSKQLDLMCQPPSHKGKNIIIYMSIYKLSYFFSLNNLNAAGIWVYF